MRKVYRFKILRLAVLLLGASPAFVVLAVALLFARADSLFMVILCIAGILFFGGGFLLGAINMPRLIRDNEALILTTESLTLRHVGRDRRTVIRWSEIAGFTERFIKSNHFIMIRLHDPKLRIEREQNRFFRSLMRWNTRSSGSPFSISPDNLHCNPDELIATLIDSLEKYGQAEADSADKQS